MATHSPRLRDLPTLQPSPFRASFRSDAAYLLVVLRDLTGDWLVGLSPSTNKSHFLDASIVRLWAMAHGTVPEWDV